ncbi:DUF4397 domain-containing protein [Enhygromyxa salina]|uniref:DUF4397 domain-containing protein n=1 Tax=Enhygromyxa salina TaxID=215803 RepID=A0A2S9YWD6_9BACT|nr:DUF4397 domain-containing protein [Enhygromyxa salina]PRQ09415.1 hypothetical protein ENSA7_08610 [Enhygromyxa salina]
MKNDAAPLHLLFPCTGLLALLAGGCVIEELPADGDGTTETTDTGDGDTGDGDPGDGDGDGDTGDGDGDPGDGDGDGDGDGICPGSEAFCTEAESHCGPDGALEICQYVPEDDCIAHFTVSCEAEVGPGSMCMDVSPTEAGCTQAAEAQIRFVNLSDGGEEPTRFKIDDLDGAELSFTQSADYQPFPVGAHDVSATNLNDDVLSNLIGYEFEAGKKYTVAAMGVYMGHPNVWVNVDSHVDDIDVPADHSRLTLVNATPDSDNGVYAQMVYDNEFFIDFYEEHDASLLEFVQQVTVDCPLPTNAQAPTTTLAAQWGIPAATAQYWQGAAFMQASNNESLYVFLTCTGACDSDEDRFVLGMLEDSSTFTVDVL